MSWVNLSTVRKVRSGKEYGLADFVLQDLNHPDVDVFSDAGGEDGVIIYDPVLLSAPVPLAPESEQGMSFTPEPDEPTPQTEDHQDNSATTTAAAPELPESCDTAPKRGRGRAKRGKKGRVAAGEELPAAGCPASSTEADRLAERTAAAWARTKRRQESKKEKKKEKKARSGIPPAHRLTFVRRAAPGVRSAQFAAPEAMHSDEGYLGRDDKRRQYNLASGSAAEILESDDNPVLDRMGRVYGVQLGWPKDWDKTWDGVELAVEALQEELRGLKVPDNRRGDFIAYATGFSFGGGPTRPSNFVHTTREREALERFFEDTNVRAVMKRADDGLHTWFPEHWELYQQMQSDLHGFDPDLTPPVPGSPFAASTVNLGPATVCWSHRDGRNLGHGLCLVCPGGKFNPSNGGHLILHEPRLIIKLSPGRLFLFPSGCVTHQNVPIAPGETRWSLTAYSAGGLWRFCAQAFKTRATFAQDHPAASAEHDRRKELRWEEGCRMFKTLGELDAYWTAKSQL